ncbi:MAG: tRNA (adenosine(37)-N6)-dimethylallyltransferase MiaA [Bacteroidales bacterium]|nr:tRNA (adenosine(37)-N6)-dimethylallyltransferase MiaA [Bacteroidales bacterium]
MKREFTMPPAMAQLPDAEVIDFGAVLHAFRSGECDLICVLGPTASGKTRYAVRLAKAINALEGRAVAEIISADSRQVYRGMTIGTGKDLDEYEEIPYHLIDIVQAGEKYDIYRYQHDFEAVYRSLMEQGKVPILCGGSGLYIEAATCAYNLPDVPADPEFRASLEERPMEELIAMLESYHPLHNSTDYDTRKRLVRAIEIARYEAEHPVNRSAFLPKNTYYIGTLVSRERRIERIDRRLDARLEEGMVEEVRSLLDGTHPLSSGPLNPEGLLYYGLEYKWVTMYINGELSLPQMREGLAIAIHRFAKRQMTWFRGMERKGIKIHWTDPE